MIGTGIGGAMIINGRLHRGRHGLGGEFGYMTTLAPAEKLNELVAISVNWKYGTLRDWKIWSD